MSALRGGRLDRLCEEREVEVCSHTVPLDGTRVAGYLVRCARSGKELGFVWAANELHGPWRWASMDATVYGERGAMQRAIEVLADIRDLHDRTGPAADRAIVKAWERPSRPERPAPRPAPPPAPSTPPAPDQKVPLVWGDGALDLTAALADQWRKR
jgi:hypothetical protein